LRGFVFPILLMNPSNVVLRTLLIYLFISVFLPVVATGQSSFNLPDKYKKETVKFQFINNLIIIPVKVNNVELSFILDTGVNKPILFNLNIKDSLDIKNVKEIYIRGLGEGEASRAYRSGNNTFEINSIYNKNQDFYVVLDEKMNVSPRLGIPVHGIIGYDFIRDFVLEINYISKKINFYRKEDYKYKECKKCEQFDLELFRNKPYIKSRVAIEDTISKDVKLLIDSGSSDALWLFEDEDKQITVPEKNFESFLGRGLSGDIYGERSRVNKFSIGTFSLEDAKVSFPDSISIRYIKKENNRNGSLGAEILKRFHVILDYHSKKITLRKNSNFKNPFKYNMSGIEIEHSGIRYVKELVSTSTGKIKKERDAIKDLFTARSNKGNKYKISLHPALVIAGIRKGSPADLAGLKREDVLISVNGKDTYEYSLQEVNEFLNEKNGKRISVVVDRDGKQLKFNFLLKRIL